jgi:hypothetical protein
MRRQGRLPDRKAHRMAPPVKTLDILVAAEKRLASRGRDRSKKYQKKFADRAKITIR